MQANNFDVIIVSNGLDAHTDDYIKFMTLTDRAYVYMTSELKRTGAKLIFLLEGGYNIEVIERVSLLLLSELASY